MTTVPWIKFSPKDWIAGASGLSASEKGIYISLIMAMYEAGEPIKNNYVHLARLCGASNSVFKNTLDFLIEQGKILLTEDGLWNERVGKEIDLLSKRSEVARGNAKCRWGKKSNENNESSMQTHCKSNAIKNIDIESDISSLRSDISFDQIRENQDFDEIEDLGNPPETSPPNSTASPPFSEPPRQRATSDPFTANSPPKAAAEREMPDERRRTPPLTEAKTQKAQVMREFDEVFWPTFPNKKAKIKARSDFVKAREKAGLAEIMAGLERYIQTKPIKREWMHPTTFLNQERWTDEPDPATENSHEQRNNSRSLYGQQGSASKSLGEQFVEIWNELDEPLGNRQSGQQAEGRLSCDFLSRARINHSGEGGFGENDYLCVEPAYLAARQGIERSFV